jgi:hypothetical protein
MFNKNFLYLFLFFFIFQIIFSFYYSSGIISQNEILNNNLEFSTKLQGENKLLEKKLSEITSIKEISQFAKENNYQFIRKSINCE